MSFDDSFAHEVGSDGPPDQFREVLMVETLNPLLCRNDAWLDEDLDEESDEEQQAPTTKQGGFPARCGRPRQVPSRDGGSNRAVAPGCHLS